MTEEPFVAREESFARVPSTNDVVRGWLADGTQEVCLAVADEQSAGRGREGRTWLAPAGRGLLASLGFRPTWLAPEHAWRLAAIVSLAMADAAEEVAGLRDGTIRLKWPNDLVVEVAGVDAGATPDSVDTAGGAPVYHAHVDLALVDPAAVDHAGVRKLGGVLGETAGLGSDDPRVIVGIGVNADWPAREFPPDLRTTMTSLREAAGGRPVDRTALLDAFLGRLEARTIALRDGRFDGAGWLARQLTNGRLVRLDGPGGATEVVRAVGVDPTTGALLVEDAGTPRGERPVFSGEIGHVRLAGGRGDEPGAPATADALATASDLGPASDPATAPVGAAVGAAPGAPSSAGRV